MRSFCLIAAASLAGLLASHKPVQAAVRVCYPSVSSEIVIGASETEAKKKALAEWQTKAVKFGPGLAAWRLAVEKALKCFPKDQAFECVAIGRPCIIRQNPKSKPVVPDQKGQSL